MHDDLTTRRMPQQDRPPGSEIVETGEQQLGQFTGPQRSIAAGDQAEPGQQDDG